MVWQEAVWELMNSVGARSCGNVGRSHSCCLGVSEGFAEEGIQKFKE